MHYLHCRYVWSKALYPTRLSRALRLRFPNSRWLMLKITNHAGPDAPANGNGNVIDSMVLIVGGFFISLGFGWMISHTRQKERGKKKEREREAYADGPFGIV